MILAQTVTNKKSISTYNKLMERFINVHNQTYSYTNAIYRVYNNITNN